MVTVHKLDPKDLGSVFNKEEGLRKPLQHECSLVLVWDSGMYPSLASNLTGSKGWPWMSELRLQACVSCLVICARDGSRGWTHCRQVFYHQNSDYSLNSRLYSGDIQLWPWAKAQKFVSWWNAVCLNSDSWFENRELLHMSWYCCFFVTNYPLPP